MKIKKVVVAIAAAASFITLAQTGCGSMKREGNENTVAVENQTEIQQEDKMQKTCPVMDGKINKELYVDVKGKRVYVCCRMCIKKIKQDPDKYIKIVLDKGESLENSPQENE
jgi:hypothetical protein